MPVKSLIRFLLIAGIAFGLVPAESFAQDRDLSAGQEPSVPSLDEILLFQPLKYPAGDWEPKNLIYQDVSFQSSDGSKLHGWYCPVSNPVAHVLYLHGNAANLTYRSRLMRRLQTQHRVAVFMPDYRGYGRSEGVPTVEGVLSDCRAAWAKLSALSHSHDRDIVIMGRSLGGALAIQLAAEKNCRGLIVESTFSSLTQVAEHHFPKLAWMVPVEKLDSETAIQKHRGPFLQSHGDRDTVVPFRLGAKLYAAASSPKVFVRIRRGRHNDAQSSEYYDQFDAFLQRLPVADD